MKIKVKYSLGHDVGNYFNALYKFRWIKHGREGVQEELLKALPESFKTALKEAKNTPEAKAVIRDYLSKDFKKRAVEYGEIARNLEQVWRVRGRGFEKKLSGLYGKPIPFKEITVYLTSLPINPYKYPEWIFVYAKTSVERQLQIVTHELNHFMFYYYFNYLKEELGKEKFESLKEALTVFTNPEEKGYPAQRELRAWLKRQTGTIPELIEKGTWKKFLFT
jgi:hypothetical protein